MAFEFELLKNHSFDAVKSAVVSLITSGKFMPAVSEILQQIDGSPDEKASLAWAKVLSALSLHGTYKSVTFDDPLVHYVINRMGGWTFIGRIEDEQLKWAGKDFDRYYNEASHLRVTWESPGVTRVLLGHADCGNNREGRELMAPIDVINYIEPPAQLPQLPAPEATKSNVIPFKIDYSKIGRAV